MSKPLSFLEPEWRALVEELVCQFAYWNDTVGGYTTGGLSTLEVAFTALGWEDDPHPYPPHRCQHETPTGERDCLKQATCGTPTAHDGYRRCCGKHFAEYQLGEQTA